MKTLALIAVVVLVVITPVCPAASAPTLTQPHLGFAITKPPGWTETRDRGPDSEVFIFTGPARAGHQPPRLVIQVLKPKTKPGLGPLAEELLGRWKNRPGFRILRRQSGRFGGQPALRLAWLYRDEANRPIRREQFIVGRGDFFYLISFTVQARDFKTHLPPVDGAVNSFRFLNQPPAGTALAGQLGTVMFGRVMPHSLAGPYYSLRYQNGTPEGALAARAHQEMMARFTALLIDMSLAQYRVLELYDRLTRLQARQAAWFDRRRSRLPDWTAGVWVREKELFRRAIQFRLWQGGQRGAVEAAINGLPDWRTISLDLAGIQLLALLQQAVNDQQALIMAQLDQVVAPSYVLNAALAQPETELPDDFRRGLGELNREQAELLPQAVAAAAETVGYARRVAIALALIKDFDRRLAQAYGRALADELPRLKAALGQAAAAGVDGDALALGRAVYHNLSQVSQLGPVSHRPSAADRFLAALTDWLVSPARAGQTSADVRRAIEASRQAWGKNIQSGLTGRQSPLKKVEMDMLPVTALKGAGTAIRHGAGAVDYATQHAAHVINYSAYSPLRVNYQGDELTSNPDLVRLHDARTQKDFVTAIRTTNDELGDEYLRDECGVGALTRGVAAIDTFGKVYITGEQAYDEATGQLKPNHTRGVLGFLGGVAYGVVTDASKAVMVLANPKTSRNEKLMATVDLVMAGGASLYAFKGTASFLGKKLTRAGLKGAQTTVKVANQAMKKAPKVVQTVYNSAKQSLTGLAKKGADKLKSLEIDWLNRTANSIKKAATETGEGSFTKTLTADLKTMTKGVVGELTEKKGALAVLKDFAKNFSPGKLVEGGINNTFSNTVLKPITVALLGDTEPAQPADTGGLIGYKPTAPTVAAAPSPQGVGRQPAGSAPQATTPPTTAPRAITPPPTTTRPTTSAPAGRTAGAKPSKSGGWTSRNLPAGAIDPIRTTNRTGSHTWSCPQGYGMVILKDTWKPKCIPRCASQPGHRWNPSLRRCEPVNAPRQQCPPGQRYDVRKQTCVSTLTDCPPGTSWSPQQQKCLPVGPSQPCPKGYRWSPRERKCQPIARRSFANIPRHLPQKLWPPGYVRHPKKPLNTFYKDYPAAKLPSGYRYSRTYLGGNLSLNTHSSIESAEQAVVTFIKNTKGRRAALGDSGGVQVRETSGAVKLRVVCRVRNVVFSVSINQWSLVAHHKPNRPVLVPKPSVPEVMARAREWISAGASFAQKQGLLVP